MRRLPVSGFRGLAGLLALSVALTILALTPFAAALEVHHALAAADQDGHQHSDTDLCQWVQHHTTTSLLAALPVVVSSAAIGLHEFPHPAALLSARLSSTGPPRGPPVS